MAPYLDIAISFLVAGLAAVLVWAATRPRGPSAHPHAQSTTAGVARDRAMTATLMFVVVFVGTYVLLSVRRLDGAGGCADVQSARARTVGGGGGVSDGADILAGGGSGGGGGDGAFFDRIYRFAHTEDADF